MQVKVHIHPTLSLEKNMSVDAKSVADAIILLQKESSSISTLLHYDEGVEIKLKRGVIIYVKSADDDINVSKNLEYLLQDGDEIYIIRAISGG